MQIVLENIAKKFKKHYVFKNVNCVFETGKKYAITGANGSGKSTFLKVVSQFVSPSKGQVSYKATAAITPENLTDNIAFCAPYLDIIEQFTLKELLVFHSKFKPLKQSIATLLAIFNYPEDKLISEYSSGMKQRVKLMLAFYSDVPVLFLDEPTSNLDEAGINWYLKLIEQETNNRIVLIASNDKREYNFCDEVLAVEDYK